MLLIILKGYGAKISNIVVKKNKSPIILSVMTKYLLFRLLFQWK